MGLSSTSFTSESMATKVKMACNEAAFNSHGQAYVYNSKGNPILSVRYRQGDGFRFYGHSPGELTSIVFAGLRKYHATREA